MSGEAVRIPSATLRPATAEDCHRVWVWRNDPETRQASFDSSPIDFAAHQAWFKASLERDDRRLYVILADGTESGVVRLDISGKEAVVSVNLAPEWRGRGVGPAALQAVSEFAFAVLDLERLVASVKPENQRSLTAFRKAGFTARAGEVGTLVRTRRAP